ncbi:MAG: hypothetical protein AAFY28_09650 [Actinomycetota bacterium]
MSVGLNGAGQFEVRNQNGNVHLIIDVVAYLVDHNHDDRYYTKAEVDAAVAAKASTTAHNFVDAKGIEAAPGQTEVISVTVATPGSSGTVIVNASGRLFNNAASWTARCSLTTGTDVDLDDWQGATVPMDAFLPYSATHAFAVGAIDSLEVHLVCDRTAGVGGSMSDIWITATYIPD